MQSQVPESVGPAIVPPVAPVAVASAAVPAAVASPAVPAAVPGAVASPAVPAAVASPAVPAIRKRGRPTAAERRAREAQILATALDVFLHSGFGNSTIEELAGAAKVTKRTVYSYFGDKSGLFAAMVKDLAVDVSLDAATDRGTLEELAARIVYRVHSDELVGLHRLVIAESSRFPELARVLYSQGDARHIARLAEHIRAERGEAPAALAEPLFSLLLGERHRRRLLGMAPAPSLQQAAAHAEAALAWLGLSQR
ncbi:MAG TPA: TetR/AcrR family transcriptional regulator [Trebonia sp.]|nr:TetR/AcrR family transcriptional regulator [Trebonia sp.]